MGTERCTEEQVHQAIELVREINQVTITGIMRELKISYTDATRIVREMEKRGVVSTPTTPNFGWKVLPNHEQAGNE